VFCLDFADIRFMDVATVYTMDLLAPPDADTDALTPLHGDKDRWIRHEPNWNIELLPDESDAEMASPSPRTPSNGVDFTDRDRESPDSLGGDDDSDDGGSKSPWSPRDGDVDDSGSEPATPRGKKSKVDRFNEKNNAKEQKKARKKAKKSNKKDKKNMKEDDEARRLDGLTRQSSHVMEEDNEFNAYKGWVKTGVTLDVSIEFITRMFNAPTTTFLDDYTLDFHNKDQNCGTEGWASLSLRPISTERAQRYIRS
jgi:hypothetical protein